MTNVVSICGCEFDNYRKVSDKVHSLGAEKKPMTTLVFRCPHCKMTYAVTPCSAKDHDYIVKACIDYRLLH